MSTMTVRLALDSQGIPTGDGGNRGAGATAHGDTDYGACIRSAGDGKYIELTNNNPLAFFVDATDIATLTAALGSGGTINSVTVTARHLIQSGTYTGQIAYQRPDNVGLNVIDFTPTDTLTSTSYVNYVTAAQLTEPGHSGWTLAGLTASVWALFPTSGGGNVYDADQCYLTVDYTGPSWWVLAAEILDGLQYRFSLVRNWYRLAVSSPGTGWGASSTPAAFGVFQSTDGFTGAATVITSGLPANPRSFAEISAFATGATETLGGSPGMGVVFDNILVYPAKTYTVGTDLPPIRIFDGISDREFVRLPKTAAGAVPKAVLSMLAANGTIYVSTFDSGTTSADWAGRIFALSLSDGTLTQVGDDVFMSGQLPYALAWHAKQLWVGTHRQAFGVKGALYRLRPELATPMWTKDADLAANSSVSSLLSFQGQLYIGTMYAAATFAKVLVRDYTGAYTTADTGTGGAATAGNGYLAFCEFNGNLYAAFWNNDTPAQAKIRKYNGSSWSTVYSTLAKPFASLFVENGYLYAYSVGLGLTASLVRSSDGTSWTDLTAQLVGSSQGLPLVGVVVR